MISDILHKIEISTISNYTIVVNKGESLRNPKMHLRKYLCCMIAFLWIADIMVHYNYSLILYSYKTIVNMDKDYRDQNFEVHIFKDGLRTFRGGLRLKIRRSVVFIGRFKNPKTSCGIAILSLGLPAEKLYPESLTQSAFVRVYCLVTMK